MSTSPAPSEVSFEELAARVDAAVDKASRLEGEGAAVAAELKQAMEAFHRDALVTIVRCLRNDPQGKQLLFELVDDPAVHAVLLLHGIIRPSVTAMAERALDRVRPYLRSHDGDVTLVEVRDGVARVRLEGSCDGCASSAETMREAVNVVLVDVDGVDAVEVVPNATKSSATEAFIPASAIGVRQRERATTGGS